MRWTRSPGSITSNLRGVVSFGKKQRFVLRSMGKSGETIVFLGNHASDFKTSWKKFISDFFALSHSPGFVGWTIVCLCTVGGIFS